MSENQAPAVRPLRERPFDIVLVVFLVTFAITSLVFDRTAAFEPDLPNATTGLAGALRGYGELLDPLVLANPLWLRFMSGISGLVFGAYYIIATYAFVRGREWIREPTLLYSGAMFYSVVVHVFMELAGDLPPPNVPLVLLIYAAYALLPVALAIRVWRPSVFHGAKAA